MQDIIFRKTQSSGSESTEPLVESAIISTPVKTSIEQLLNAGSKVITSLQRRLTPSSRQFVLLKAARNPLPTLEQKPVPIIGKPVKLLQLTAGKLHPQLRSPLGIFSLVQGIAIIALFTLVLTHTTKKTPTATVAAAGAIVTNSGQFLPIANTSSSKTVTSAQTTNTNNTTPLDVWATPWNLTSLTSTNYHSISAFWGTIDSDGVTLDPKASWSLWDTFVATETSPKPTLFLTVSADPTVISGMLGNQAKETTQITNLLAATEQHGFNGIDIDYEGLGRENRDLFTAYIKTLTTAFHAANKQVAVTLEVNTSVDPPMDWYRLGQTVDEIRIMAYDYHSQNTGTPGPIAPIGWIQEILQYAQSQVSMSKVVIGIGNYGYDWTTPVNSSSSWTGTALSADQATAEATQYKQAIVRQTGIDTNGYDIGSVPEFTYTDTDGNLHDVWYEDAQSLQAKEVLISQFHPAAIIFWTVGLTDPS